MDVTTEVPQRCRHFATLPPLLVMREDSVHAPADTVWLV